MSDIQSWKELSGKMFTALTGKSPVEKDCVLDELVSAYKDFLTAPLFEKYQSYFENNDSYKEYFTRMIKSDYVQDNCLKDSSGIVLALFLSDNIPAIFQNKWPFSENEMNQIMQIVGM